MSIDATRWAWACRVKPASAKLVLLSLADRADGVDFECFPSIDLISDDTGLDRKTVITSIQKLSEIGLITKCHRPNKSALYRLNGVPERSSDEVFHVVYRTQDTETGEYYIGVHTTANLSDKYKGSGRWISAHQNKQQLRTEILEQFTSRRDALERELELIRSCLNDPFCRNRRAEVGNLAQSIEKHGSTVFGTTEGAGSTENGTATISCSGVPKTDNGSTENGTPVVPKTGHEPKKNLPRTYQGETVRRARVREDCSAGTSADPLFEKFWRAYPRKCSKGQAERAFAKINPDEQLTAEIIAGIERAMTLDSRFLDGGYIPHPATWLNAKGWMDEFDQGPAKPATSSAYAGNKSRTQSKASDNASAVQEAIARFQRRQNLIDGECYEIN